MFKRGDLITEKYPTCYHFKVGTVLTVIDGDDGWVDCEANDAITGKPHGGYIGPYSPECFKLVKSEEKTMFEVGKKYKTKHKHNGLKVVEVLAVTRTFVIVKGLIWEASYETDMVGSEKAWDTSVFYNWEEYIEPKVTVWYENVWRDRDIDPRRHSSLEDLNNNTCLDYFKRLAIVEYIHTEGVGVAVRVVG